MKALLLTAILCCTTVIPAATPRTVLTGTVVDDNGSPVPDVTVMIYHAGVKTGYSLYCPSCYTDCAKHVLTDSKGNFQINDLAGDLWFTLLAARDGYIPKITKSVDPAKLPHVSITLAPKPATSDFSGTVRGRLVDEDGSPIPNAIINPTGLVTGPNGDSGYGTLPGLQPIAISNPKGEFEVTYDKPTPKMLLQVEARAMAPRFVVVETGAQRHSITLSEGATITGRLIANGKPVPNAEIGLIAKERGGFQSNLKISGDPYDEIRIGTGPDGRFTIPNVPEPVDWFVYAKMDSVSSLGATSPIEVKTDRDHQYLQIADLLIQPGYRVRGTVQISDGKPVPEGMHISLSAVAVWDTQTIPLAPNGHFEFTSLPPGKYDIWASVKGYKEKDEQRITVSHDIDNFTTTVYPNR